VLVDAGRGPSRPFPQGADSLVDSGGVDEFALVRPLGDAAVLLMILAAVRALPTWCDEWLTFWLRLQAVRAGRGRRKGSGGHVRRHAFVSGERGVDGDDRRGVDLAVEVAVGGGELGVAEDVADRDEGEGAGED
jgi:hypothetical protein